MTAPIDELKTRIHHATVQAQEAFWTAIASAFPEAKAGDFAPDVADTFDRACISAASAWVYVNCGRTNAARVARTSDGYAFTEQPDGSWTDGDMTFDSLTQLLEQDPDATISVQPE